MRFKDICEHCGVWLESHDYEHMARECCPKQIAKLEAEKWAIVSAVVQTVGGKVEGKPTCGINYLQRLRELVHKEEVLDGLAAAYPFEISGLS